MKALGLTSRPPVGETHSNFNWVETYQPTLKKGVTCNRSAAPENEPLRDTASAYFKSSHLI